MAIGIFPTVPFLFLLSTANSCQRMPTQRASLRGASPHPGRIAPIFKRVA
jgi:hypothetical protein